MRYEKDFDRKLGYFSYLLDNRHMFIIMDAFLLL